MTRLSLYRLLMGSLGIAFFLFGAALVAAFFLYQRPNSVPIIPTGPVGHYFVAFTGCALLAWSGGLVGAARNPLSSRTIGTMTAFVLMLMALIRMVAWTIGDYYEWLGELPRTEATAFLLTALALVWLRPTVAESMGGSEAKSLGAEPESGSTT
jgi:hypothetical protein